MSNRTEQSKTNATHSKSEKNEHTDDNESVDLDETFTSIYNCDSEDLGEASTDSEDLPLIKNEDVSPNTHKSASTNTNGNVSNNKNVLIRRMVKDNKRTGRRPMKIITPKKTVYKETIPYESTRRVYVSLSQMKSRNDLSHMMKDGILVHIGNGKSLLFDTAISLCKTRKRELKLAFEGMRSLIGSSCRYTWARVHKGNPDTRLRMVIPIKVSMVIDSFFTEIVKGTPDNIIHNGVLFGQIMSVFRFLWFCGFVKTDKDTIEEFSYDVSNILHSPMSSNKMRDIVDISKQSRTDGTLFPSIGSKKAAKVIINIKI